MSAPLWGTPHYFWKIKSFWRRFPIEQFPSGAIRTSTFWGDVIATSKGSDCGKKLPSQPEGGGQDPPAVVSFDCKWIWLWSVHLLGFSAIQIQETGQGCKYFIDKKRLQKDINIKKNYINVFLKHNYSLNYFMIMVWLGGLLHRGLCLGWAGNILINEFGNSWWLPQN